MARKQGGERVGEPTVHAKQGEGRGQLIVCMQRGEGLEGQQFTQNKGGGGAVNCKQGEGGGWRVKSA